MAADNKNLEIGVVVNDQQMGKFKNSIREATIEVQKLAEGLNRAASAFKGFLSGARSGAGSGSNFQAGNGFSRAPMSGGMGQPVLAIAGAIKGAAKESGDALKFLETGVRSSSSKMVGDIVNLDRVLASVEKRFKSIRSVSSGGSAIPGLSGGGGGSLIPADASIVNRGGIDYVQGKRSMWQNLMAGGDIGGDDFKKTLRKAVPYALAARGLYSLGSEIAAQPNDWMNQQSKYGGYGSTALAMQQGRDFTTNYAMKRIKEEDRTSMIAKTSNAHIQQRMIESSVSQTLPSWTPNFIRNAFTERMKRTLAEGDSPGNAATDLRGNTSFFNSAWAMAKAAPSAVTSMSLGPMLRAYEGADPDETVRKLDYVQKYGAAHAPEVGFRARAAYGSSWESSIGLMRQLGTSDPWTLAAKLRGQGFNTGDLAGGQQSVAALGGWGNRGLGYTAMHATAGHVDVGNLMGATTQAGGNANRIASYIAGLGIDPHAQTAIAGALTSQIMNGGSAIDQTGSLAALSAFNGRGSSPGEQMRIAAGQAGGMGAINNDLFGGGIDNLQKGRNIVNAISATGGNNLFGSQYLADHFDFGMLANARRGGKNPASLEARGVDSKQVIAYGDLTLGSMFRNIALGGKDTPMGKLANEMIGSGFGSDPGKFIRANRNKKGFDVNKTVKTMAAMFATEGYGGGNEQIAEGMVRDLAGLDNMGKLRAGHFKDASHGTNSRRTAAAVGKNDADTAAHIKNITPEEAAKTPGEVAQGYADISQRVGASSDRVADRLFLLADAIEAATSRINGAGKGYVK